MLWITKTYSLKLETLTISAFADRIEIWCQTKGPKWTINRLKNLRIALLRFLSSENNRFEYMAYRKDLIYPKVLPLAKEVQSGDICSIRSVMTLLSISRWIDWNEEPNYDNITKPSTACSGEIQRLAMEAVNVYYSWIYSPVDPDWSHFHTPGSQGPNGPALAGSTIDLSLLDQDYIRNLKILGGEKFTEELDKCIGALGQVDLEEYKKHYACKDRNTLRRIALVYAPEGKTRPIAIFDYWAQTVLKPLHDRLFSILKGISTDCTFNQISRLVPNNLEQYYCYDLSAATDRFPVLFQEVVLGSIIGEERAAAWRYIMTHKEFTFPNGARHTYSVGQPMGGYSSWAMFTLCHHLIVQVAARRVRKFPFDQYSLLGDDIVIYDKEVAECYLGLLTKLGVEVSIQKSIISYDIMEFAKRYFYRGSEITGLQSRAIYDTHGFYANLWATLYNYQEQGWPMPLPGAIKSFYSILGKPGSFATRLARKIYRLDTLRNLLTTHSKDYSLARKFFASCNFTFSCNMRENIIEFLLEIVASHKLLAIQNTLESSYKEIFINEKFMESICSAPEDAPSSVHCLPILQSLRSKTNEVVQESKTTEEIVRQRSWSDIIELDLNWLPSPRTLISGRVSQRKVRTVNLLVNKVCFFISEEARLIASELESDPDAP